MTKKTEEKEPQVAAPGLSPKEARAALNKQFSDADDEGKAAIIEETQAGLGVRGF